MTDQTESEYAELLADLDFYDEDNWRNVMRQYPGAQDAIRKAAAAIRALEAKAAYWRDEVTRRDDQYAALLDGHMAVVDDRDRLAGEVERLSLDLANARKEYELDRPWATEVVRLTSELAKARENEARYLWLRTLAVGSGMNGGTIKWSLAFYAPDSDSDEVFDAAVDDARSAGGGA